MTITIGSVRRFLAVAIFLSVSLSSVAFAAQDDSARRVKDDNSQPYVVAQSASSIIGFNLQEKPIIVQDAFLAALQAHIKLQTPVREMYVASTGYNSEEAQTDSTPFISADGTHVYWGMVAANFLPFGAKIKIPDYYGDKVFVVHDRMNKRYWERVDVWFPEKPQALQWGVRKVRIQILGS